MGFVDIEPDGEHLIITLQEDDKVEEVFVFLAVDPLGKQGFLRGPDGRPFVAVTIEIATQMKIAAEARAHLMGKTARMVRFVRGAEIVTH